MSLPVPVCVSPVRLRQCDRLHAPLRDAIVSHVCADVHSYIRSRIRISVDYFVLCPCVCRRCLLDHVAVAVSVAASVPTIQHALCARRSTFVASSDNLNVGGISVASGRARRCCS